MEEHKLILSLQIKIQNKVEQIIALKVIKVMIDMIMEKMVMVMVREAVEVRMEVEEKMVDLVDQQLAREKKKTTQLTIFAAKSYKNPNHKSHRQILKNLHLKEQEDAHQRLELMFSNLLLEQMTTMMISIIMNMPKLSKKICL